MLRSYAPEKDIKVNRRRSIKLPHSSPCKRRSRGKRHDAVVISYERPEAGCRPARHSVQSRVEAAACNALRGEVCATIGALAVGDVDEGVVGVAAVIRNEVDSPASTLDAHLDIQP